MRPIQTLLSIPMLSVLLLTGCTTVKEHSSPVELRPASNSAFQDWQRTDFHVGGLDTWVAPEATLTREQILFASQATNPAGDHTVTLEFTDQGANAMNELSNHRMSRPVAVLLDGRIIAAPVLMQPVRDTLTINFGSTKTAAKEAGALEQAVNDPQTADSTASDPS